MFDLLDAVPLTALPILRFSFRAPGLFSDCPLLTRISILPVFPILVSFRRLATYLCVVTNANDSGPFCRDHRMVREITFYLVKENFQSRGSAGAF